MSKPSSHCDATNAIFRGLNLRPEVQRKPIFDIPSLQIPPGITWLGGGEGCGKTSMLQILAGALASPGSELQIADYKLSTQAQAYRQQVAWFDPLVTTMDQVPMRDFFKSTADRFAHWDQALLQRLATAMGLEPHAHKPLYMLSTGTKRKVWLCAALASGAALTLLDEPFAALDKSSIHCVLDFLTEAASHRTRAWVVADYQAPAGVPLAHTIDLGDSAPS